MRPGNLSELRAEYPEGTEVVLISMDDLQAPPPKTKGKVASVDDLGDIHVRWETGQGLALIPDVDLFEKIEKP